MYSSGDRRLTPYTHTHTHTDHEELVPKIQRAEFAKIKNSNTSCNGCGLVTFLLLLFLTQKRWVIYATYIRELINDWEKSSWSSSIVLFETQKINEDVAAKTATPCG